MHNCEQMCEPSDKEPFYTCKCNDQMYTDDGKGKCSLKEGMKCDCKKGFCDKDSTDCKCINGFKYNKVKEDCELDGRLIFLFYNLIFEIIIFHCLIDESLKDYCQKTSIKDDKLFCNCSEHFDKSGNELCKVKSLCGKNQIGRKICDERHAKCLIDENKIGEFFCQCPIGKIFPDNPDKIDPLKDSLNSSCIDICDYHDVEHSCSVLNAKCNPTKFNLAEYINEEQNNLPHHPEKYCDCSPGFFMKDSKGCRLAKYSTKIKFIIKNTYFFPNNLSITQISPEFFIYHSNSLKRSKRAISEDYNVDLNGYYEALQQQSVLNFELEEKAKYELLRYEFMDLTRDNTFKILHSLKLTDNIDKVGIKKCEPYLNAKDFYDCEIVVVLDKHFDKYNISESLKNECKHSEKDLTHCFFIQNNMFVEKEKSFEAMNYDVMYHSITLKLNFS